jgi:putative flippase GtrA
MRLRELVDASLTGGALIGALLNREVRNFLAVGGAGYVVDVAAFNLLRSVQPFARLDPSVARTIAVALAMCVTYLGNRNLTWREHSSSNRHREVGLFVLFNCVGFGFSVFTLVLSHDVLGLTSGLADNISANVVGLALGTIFRYLTYKRFVFAPPHQACQTPARQPVGVGGSRVPDDEHKAAGSSNRRSESQTRATRVA